MSRNAHKVWLVGYDVSSPRRLRKVHRYLKNEAASAQYSVFAFVGRDSVLDRVFDDLRGLIDTKQDDVRGYHIPEHCQVWALGRQSLPPGITLPASKLTELIGAVIPVLTEEEAD